MSINNIDIACVSETFLKPNDRLHAHKDYTIESLPRCDDDDEHRSGGVALIIRRGLCYTLHKVPRTKLVEAIGAKFLLNGNRFINIFSLYLPGGASNRHINAHFINDLKSIIRQAGSNYFLCGDVNSKHRFWNCIRANRAGTLLYDFYCHNNFMIFHPDEPTHHPSASSHQPSTIDIVISDGSYRISTLECHAADSDHSIVTFDVDVIDQINERERAKVPCFKLTDYNKYQTSVSNALDPYKNLNLKDITNTEQIDTLVDALTDAVLVAQEAAVPKVAPNRYELMLPQTVKDMIRERNNCIRTLQRNPNLRDQLRPHINWLTAQIRNNINEIRNQNWNQKLASIPHDDNYRTLFQTAKFLKNRDRTLPPLKVDNQHLITPQEKANSLALQFKKNHENPLENFNTTHTKHVDSKVQRFMRNCPTSLSPKYTTMEELQSITKKMKNCKAPGMDKVHNSLVKKLPPVGFFLLGIIINASLKMNYFPTKWKHAKVVPIKKPGKPSSSPNSYRPISLLSSFSKLLERVILIRLQKHLDERNVIPHQQHGFQRGKSTSTLLVQLISKIKTALASGTSTGMILLDVEKAFDRVWHTGLLYKLICANTPHYLVKMTASFLENRTFHVEVNGFKSSNIQIKYGVPQGAVCSPTLYNIYTADLPKEAKCDATLFADDTAFTVSSRFAKHIEKELQVAFKRVKGYFGRWKILINDSKTQAIYFTKRRTKQIPIGPLRLLDSNVEWEPSVKYLGVVLDPRLTLRAHMQYVANKAHKAIRILYSMLSRRSNLDARNKQILYKVGIRPIMTYAAPVINQSAKSNLNRLQVVQNKCLRMILDSEPGTSNIQLHEEVVIEWVKEFVQRLTDKFEVQHASF